jgi:hypothetical protein
MMMRTLQSKTKTHQPETNGFVKGKQALREWWQDAFRLPSLNYKVKSLTANGDRVFMEYIRIVDGEDEMHVAEVLDIREIKLCKSISRIKQSVLLYRFNTLENHIIKIPFGSNQLGFFICKLLFLRSTPIYILKI